MNNNSKKNRQPKADRMNFTSDAQATDRFDKKNVAAAHQAVLPPMRPTGKASGTAKNEKKGKKASPPHLKAPLSRPKLKGRLQCYLDLLARPFDAEICKSPINYNPVPSFMTSVARLTSTVEALNVPIQATAQVAFWPGHNLNSDSDAMDGVAYHARLQSLSGVTYSIGPVAQASGAPGGATNGAINNNIVLGGATPAVGTAGLPIAYDQGLPYIAALGSGDHTRWKLLALGIRIQNTTPIVSRAGDVVSVQLTNTVNLANFALQREFAKYPTFNVTTKANTGTYEVSWIPNPTDMAFWHSVTATESPVAALLEDAGLILWFNNPSNIVQTYKFEVVYHWELAGDSLVSVSSPSVLQPLDKGIVEPTLDVLKFTSHTAASAPSIAQRVASGIDPFVSGATKLVGAAAKLAPEIAAIGSLFM